MPSDLEGLISSTFFVENQILGCLRGKPKQHKKDMPKKNDFERAKKPDVRLAHRLLEAFRGAKIDQNRIQNETKFMMIFKSEKVALQEPLGAVLGRSWGIWEAILGSKFALRY